ncbi:MAG: WD40 repeat domain-containing serine/threonine protein kinase [Isosphaeraceae bacterium]
MVQPIDDEDDDKREPSPADSSDDDERVGEAVEAYLAVAEQGRPPDIEEFAGRYAELKDDVKAALEGLELVHGLLGLGSAGGSGGGRGLGLERRIESGRRIAGYRVVRELGRGGMGTVYEAVHVGLDRPVALKVLGTHAAPDSSARRRFLNEARTAAGLHHTHIVPVFDVGQVGGLCYYAMQRIEGSGLDCVLRHLRRTRPQAAGGAEAAAGALFRDSAAVAAASASGSRVSRLWVRVSSGWPWRQPRYIEVGQGSGDPRNGSLRAGHTGAPSGVNARSELGDSTASWGTGSRRASDPDHDAAGNGAGRASSPNSLRTLTSSESGSRSRENEPPPFDPPRGTAYFRWIASAGFQAADALAHAHHQGVIHRDVKPSNLLIDGRGTIWVTDFGLARRLADPGITHHDSLLGTPRYMSPEQARTGAIDGRTDVYSLGATLYELMTLRPPFDGKSASELIDQIGQKEPLSPRMLDSHIPRDLETIVLKALAKRPADRYATAADLAADLARFLNREPVKARRISPVGRLWRVACRHPGITSVTATAAAAILAIATFAYLRVVAARDAAIQAQYRTNEALKDTEQANRKTQDALLKQYLSEATLLRSTNLPDRRARGLKLIQKAVEYNPNAQVRSEFRDAAVELLVLRSVENHESDIGTGRVLGVVVGPESNRLAALADDGERLGERLDLWDLVQRRRLDSVSLRLGTGAAPDLPPSQAGTEANGTDAPAGERAEPGQGANSAAGSGANTPRGASGAIPPGPRRPLPWSSQRLALAGHALAVVLPDGKGFRLIDALSGATLRTVLRPGSELLGLVADPGGERLVTIESFVVIDENVLLALVDGAPLSALPGIHVGYQYHVNLWDLDHLDQPVARLPWSRPGPSPRPSFPLVAISPDGKIVAVAALQGTRVRLFSGVDGAPLRFDQGPLQQRRGEIETQTELGALAIGPNSLLATSGRSTGGGAVRLWDLDTEKSLANLPPSGQTFTSQMRFSPQGRLLALIGRGPTELWDPVALTLVAALPTSEPVADLAFGAHGRTIAAAGRTSVTSLWTVVDSAARTQLSGFDNERRPSSLAFNREGILAGGTWDGGIWFWQPGRCPDINAIRPEPSLTPRRAVAGRENQGRRGPDRGNNRERDMGRPAVVGFDAEGRLIAVDSLGLRIWPARTTSNQAPPAIEVPYPTALRGPGLGWFGMMRMSPVARTPDGSIMAVVRSAAVFLWRCETPERLIPVVVPGQPAAQVAASPPSGTRRTAPGGPDNPSLRYRTIQIAPDGRRLYLIDLSSQPHVWELETKAAAPEASAREVRWPLPVAEGGINTMALCPDGTLLAVADRSGAVLLVETKHLTVVGRIKPPGDQAASFFLALAFSPDGRSLAVGSQQEGMISVWSLDQPSRPRRRLNLPGHRGLFTLVFDPQGRRLASQGSDPLVEVWDLELIQRELYQWGLVE